VNPEGEKGKAEDGDRERPISVKPGAMDKVGEEKTKEGKF